MFSGPEKGDPGEEQINTEGLFQGLHVQTGGDPRSDQGGGHGHGDGHLQRGLVQIPVSGMRAAMDVTERRRAIQNEYNEAHGIVPRTIIKGVREVLEISKTADAQTARGGRHSKLSEQERSAEITRLEQEMREASKLLEFEYAAVLRDRIIELRGEK